MINEQMKMKDALTVYWNKFEASTDWAPNVNYFDIFVVFKP